ncbi:hypothetical protein [Solihabitans fulvus]|nr:hypothetical protein [Solihabitans fulvus]
MEDQVLELQELPERDERVLEPTMCCDTGHDSFQPTDVGCLGGRVEC